ncbi:traB domain-containing protein [Sabethes cyaneus]|uniref:traB domain-containing protein n=1 Tax=Sabethes cyaneus TaxID=53552 RepID=UPI00221E31E8|nr:traB domain-containing protein [Sabethes cyaneus]XP_053692932.1 traB domain-containing protein [Sabethes cyaneus]
MSSPISSASEYNSALDESLDISPFNPRKLDISLTESDIENVNLSQEWNALLKPDQKKKADPRDASRLLLDSLKNNNVDSSSQTTLAPNRSLSASLDDTLNTITTASTISPDVSALSIGDGASTSSVLSSSDEASLVTNGDELVVPDHIAPNVSQVSDDNGTPSTKDSRDTTHNVSLLPVDDDQLTVTTTEPIEPKEKDSIKIYDSQDEFDRNLPDTVTLLTTPEGSKVYLVGTAHFSESSQNDVSLVMRNVQPNVVMLELCPSRIHILKYDEQTLLEEAKDINLAKIQSIIKRNGAINGLFYILLLNMSAKITQKLGMAPGGEFRRAVKEAAHIPNCIIQLGDRQFNVTLQRALRGLSLWQTIKLIPKLLIMDDISSEDVEQCKRKDLLEEIMLEMAGEFPAFGRVFVEERDLYLCYSLQVAAMPQQMPDNSVQPVNVVGVVGIGHAAGIAKHWGKVEHTSIASIVTIPPASLSHRAAKLVLKYGTLGLCAYGVFRFMRPRLSKWL